MDGLWNSALFNFRSVQTHCLLIQWCSHWLPPFSCCEYRAECVLKSAVDCISVRVQTWSEVSLWLTAWGQRLNLGFGLVTGGLDSSTEVRIIHWLQTRLRILPDSLWRLSEATSVDSSNPGLFPYLTRASLEYAEWDAKHITKSFNQRELNFL